MKHFVIAIDGEAGSGKGTLGAQLAKRLGFLHLDTGALYRCATVLVLESGINPKDEKAVTAIASKAKIEAKLVGETEHYFLNNRDLSLANALRTPEVNNTVSIISPYPRLRELIRSTQHKIASMNNMVIEGRDITTVVFPNADVKFYVTADLHIRAQRRLNDYKKQGISITLKEVEDAIIERDKNDKERENCPLVCAKDAIVIDNGTATIKESVQKMYDIVQDKLNSQK